MLSGLHDIVRSTNHECLSELLRVCFEGRDSIVQQLTTATVPGRHDTMMTAPHVDRLATAIDHLLTQTVTETAAG